MSDTIAPRDSWPERLPKDRTVVFLTAGYGTFIMPVGYFDEPWQLVSNFYRRDVLSIFVGQLTFLFSMPSGGYASSIVSKNSGGILRRPREETPDGAQYSVWFSRMRKPTIRDDFRDKVVELTDDDAPLDKLQTRDVIDSTSARYFMGTTLSFDLSYRIGISGSCNLVSRICGCRMYFPHFGFVSEVLYPQSHMGDTFEIAKTASRLLSQWRQ